MSNEPPDHPSEMKVAAAAEPDGDLRTDFHVLTDSLPQMIWTTRPDGHHEYYNQRWYDFTGVPEGSTDGEGWNDLFHPDDRERAWDAWQRSLATGELYQIEYRLRRRDGVYRWVLGRALPRRDRNGVIREWFGTCTDIEDLKRAEIALHASEANFRTMADSIPQLAWMMNAEGCIYWYNRRWYDYTGTTLDMVHGDGWQSVHHPDHLERVSAKLRAHISTGEDWEDTFPLRSASGEYRWFLSRAVPIHDERGRVVRWFGTNTDITEQRASEATLKRNEARFRSVVEATAAIVWTAMPDGSFANEQSAWLQFTGQAPAEHLGWGRLDRIHPEDQERTRAAWAAALDGGGIYQVEQRLRRHDGVYRTMMVRATPMLDEAGAIVEWVGIHTDITELKEAEQALKRLNETLEAKVESRTAALVKARVALESVNRNLEAIVTARTAELQAANEEIKRFAYIVSHDLRAPLVNIMGFTSEIEASGQLIKAFYERAVDAAPGIGNPEMDELVATDFDEAIGFIRSSTAKMDRLINAILTLSRAERRMLVPETIAMRPFLETFSSNLAHQLSERDAEIVVDDVPDLVSDRLALEQVFANLVENAVKYLDPNRPGRIRISGTDDGNSVTYTISDNGRGIDPKDYERIFELFRRAGVQDRPGEGIGLAHVRAMVRKLGGQVTVESEPGVGSRFTVMLPKTHYEYKAVS